MSIKTSDGSCTLFSKEYQESYHSLKDGAINETLFKHVFPAFSYAEFGETIRVLDICFGLGYNSFFTLKHFLSTKYSQRLEIYSPEKDIFLFHSLKNFEYPTEIFYFDGIGIGEILRELDQTKKYIGKKWKLECYLGDAIRYIQEFPDNFFDMIYQDAFSPTKNPQLWSNEYFKLLYQKLAENGVVTTYSQSSLVKNHAIQSGFKVYEIKQGITRNSRIFCKKEIKCKNLQEK